MNEPIRRKRREVLTDKMVSELKRKKKRYVKTDPEQVGHYVRVPTEGPCVYAAVARHGGKQVWARLGTADTLGIEEARKRARAAILRIRSGLPAFEPPPVQPDSVADVAENWLKRHVMKKKLRTGDEMERILKRYVLPAWRDRAFKDIRRSDVAALIDDIEDEHGKWTADAALSVLRSVSSWFATRNDDYTPPFVKGMRRTTSQERKRSRVLGDSELRTLWEVADQAGGFGAFLQVLLLSAQRRDKVTTLQWKHLDGDIWTIETKPNEKGNAGALKLPPLAMKIINAQPHVAGNPYVFSGRGKGPMVGFSNRHKAFREACQRAYNDASEHDWTLHDLRRTARSLMSKAGVSSEHAERVLGHALPAIEGVYNVHPYLDEKSAALKRLASLIEGIVHGESGENVSLRAQP